MTNGTEIEAKVTVSTETLADKVEVLRNKISQLQGDIFQRNEETEENIRLARRQTEQEIGELRDEYDKALNQGDKAEAEKILDRIAEVRKRLVTLAKNIKSSSEDFSDLESRRDELHSEVMVLCEAAKKNFFKSKEVNQQAPGLSGTMAYSVGIDIRKLKEIAEEAKKVAEQVLNE